MIFYFSATGNCKYTAQKLSESLGERMIDITRAMKNGDRVFRLEDGEDIGLVCPVYYGVLPDIVRRFLEGFSVRGSGSGYTYAVMTCGANSGNSKKKVEELFASHDLPLTAFYSVRMVSTYIALLGGTSQKEAEKALVKADREIEMIAAHIADHDSGNMDTHRTKLPSPGKAVYDAMRKTKDFHADDRCTRCGLCAEVCPDGAIEMTSDGPVWRKSKCEHCMACICRCPEQALQYGDKTEKKYRYTNPNIDL